MTLLCCKVNRRDFILHLHVCTAKQNQQINKYWLSQFLYFKTNNFNANKRLLQFATIDVGDNQLLFLEIPEMNEPREFCPPLPNNRALQRGLAIIIMARLEQKAVVLG